VIFHSDNIFHSKQHELPSHYFIHSLNFLKTLVGSFHIQEKVHVIAFGHNAHMEFIQYRGIDMSFKSDFILRHILLAVMFFPLKIISFG
jgi:hypothetical protein